MILRRIVSEIQGEIRRGVSVQTVFDLDSTLFCVSPRTEHILRMLSSDHELQKRFSEETRQLATVKVTPTDWGLRTALVRHQIRSTIDFFETIRLRWMEDFFSSRHLHVDTPYEGAVKFVNHLHELGATVRYLTGRDAPRMGEGTLQSLKKWEFPLPDASRLHMKPVAERHDADFKREFLEKLKAPNRVIWFFENEPVIINLVRQALPEIKIVFVDSVHSGREIIPDDLPRISRSFVFG